MNTPFDLEMEEKLRRELAQKEEQRRRDLAERELYEINRIRFHLASIFGAKVEYDDRGTVGIAGSPNVVKPQV